MNIIKRINTPLETDTELTPLPVIRKGGISMPTISFFYGLIIRMYADDNARHHLPHFHVFYSGEEAVFTLEGELL